MPPAMQLIFLQRYSISNIDKVTAAGWTGRWGEGGRGEGAWRFGDQATAEHSLWTSQELEAVAGIGSCYQLSTGSGAGVRAKRCKLTTIQGPCIADLHKLSSNQNSVVQAAIHNALGLHLHLPLLQPQGHIYVHLCSHLLLQEEGQLGLLAVLNALNLYQLSLHAKRQQTSDEKHHQQACLFAVQKH